MINDEVVNPGEFFQQKMKGTLITTTKNEVRILSAYASEVLFMAIVPKKKALKGYLFIQFN